MLNLNKQRKLQWPLLLARATVAKIAILVRCSADVVNKVIPTVSHLNRDGPLTAV